ncbi:MAG: cupin domain-containing protein [Gammaproteobacteria bacterium]
MLDYTDLKDKGGLEPWPPMEELPFINVLEGNPQHSGRFDEGGFGIRTQVGVWECTPGKFEYTYPGDEICTLFEGEISVVDEHGNTHEYRAGDTFYMRKGEVGIWTVRKTIKKVFFIHDPAAEELAHKAA